MTTLAPGAIWRPVRACSSHPVSPDLGLVMHVQQGDNSPFGWFARPESRSSSTWWIGKAGQLEQYVDLATSRAWAQGAGNSAYHSVEFAGWVAQPLTDAQLDTAARLYAWGAAARGWPLRLAEAPGQHGFGWHGMGAKVGWGHPDCPGPLRRAQRGEILLRAARLGHPSAIPKTATATDEDDMTPEQDARLKAIEIQLTTKWPQLGDRTLVDALAEVRSETRGTFDFGGGQPKTTLVGAVGRLVRKLGA